MVRLFCAIVGVAGSVFPVELDASQSVGHLKDAIKKENSAAITCDAKDLQLFPAKKGDAWLTHNEVKQGVHDTSGLTLLGDELAPLSLVGLSEKDVWIHITKANVADGNVPVHVLVKLPDPCGWELADEECPFLAFDSENPIIHIPKAYAQGSGLHVGKDQGVQKEWEALWTSVVQSYALLWIVGPPGTGKSCAAFAFACSLKRVGADVNSGQREEKWDVLWIHCPKKRWVRLFCILFSGEKEKRTCAIIHSQLGAVLESLGDYTVVFLDGYVKERDQHAVLDSCGIWRFKNEKCRRIVIVCSMVSLGKDWRPDLYDDIPATVASSLESMSISPAMKLKATQGVIQEKQLFQMFSWTLSEYQEALKNDEFFEHVKTLTAERSVEMETLMELLEEKFFVVGGRAQMMFDVSTQRAMDSLLFALNSTHDITGTQYLEGTVGCSSVSVINGLFSWYPGVVAARPQPCIVST